MVNQANDIWRNYELDGVSASGAHEPIKQEIREWGTWVESIITAFTSTGGSVYQTKAEMDADRLNHEVYAIAWCLDPNPTLAGVYQKNWPLNHPSSYWKRLGDLPYSFVKGEVSGGTVNAVQATTTTPYNANALFIIRGLSPNSATPVTISINGGTALTVKTASGGNVPVNGMPPTILGTIDGTNFRLASDVASSAIIASAEAAATRAEQARDQAIAAASAATAELPSRFYAATYYHPTVGPDFIRVAGFLTPGDGGGYLAKKVASQPTHAGRFPVTLADNVTVQWYELVGNIVNPMMFGAKGDNTGNDAVAWNNAIAYIKSRPDAVKPTLKGAGRLYRITDTINLTGLRFFMFQIDGEGCLITAATAGKPAFDGLDSEHVKLCNLAVYGDPAAAPNYGLQIGRGVMAGTSIGRGAAYWTLDNVFMAGSYTQHCLINSASEIFRANKCDFWNGNTGVGAGCYYGDANRRVNLTSQFMTVDVPNNVYSSFNDVIFTNCTFERISLTANGYAIILSGKTHSQHFVNCYGQSENGGGFLLYGEHIDPVFDIHWEATNLKWNYVAETGTGDVTLHNAKIVEYYLFATNSMFTTNGGAGTLHIIGGSEVSVRDIYSNFTPLFFKAGGTGSINFQGMLKLGSNTHLIGNLNNIANFNGEIECDMALSLFDTPSNRPAGGSFIVRSARADQVWQFGVTVNKAVLNHGVGPNLTAASTLVIPPSGSFFYVVGNTNINSIAVNPYDGGRLITLLFQGTLNLQNSASLGTLLAGSLSVTPNRSITLFCNGALWVEVARSANVAA